MTYSIFYNNAVHTVRLNALFCSRNASDLTMRYLLRTNTSYEHLAKKFEQAVLTCVVQDSSEMAVCLQRFFVCQQFLASENGLYELTSTFCHVGPGFQSRFVLIV